MNQWPLQSGADDFYGNPRGRNGRVSPLWMLRNLTHIEPPFAMTYAGDAISHVVIHRKCADSLSRILQTVWDASKHDQKQVDDWGASIFGGSFNYRLKRGSSTLSMHAYACAIDLAPDRFPMGRARPTFCAEVLNAFAAEGWINLPRDRMHFQAARLN